jgi:hypothetical protein
MICRKGWRVQRGHERQTNILCGLDGMTHALLIIALVLVGVSASIYLLWLVHRALDGICLRHARRFCKRQGWEIRRARCQSAFKRSGVKTEFTLVQLDCLDGQRQRRLILLLVWPFGVRKLVNDERYPETYDSQWP